MSFTYIVDTVGVISFQTLPSSKLVRLVAATLLAVALRAQSFSGEVVGISDGDTIRVMNEGKSERVRLWGIDAPELHQAFGTRAKQLASELAFGKTVVVQVKDIDRYKRKVAEVILL